MSHVGRPRIFNYDLLRRQFISSDLSLREICRRNNIGNGRGSVNRIARAEEWVAQRRLHRARLEVEAIVQEAHRNESQTAQPISSDNPGLDLILAEVRREFLRAQKFGAFNSEHEGYAVIAEELDELWDAVKSNDWGSACRESIQVAAMGVRFFYDLSARSTR